MPAEFSDAIQVGGDLVFLIEGRGQSNYAASDAGVVDRLIAVREEAVRNVLVDAPVAIRGKEPEPILLDRSTFGGIEIPHFVEGVRSGQAGLPCVGRVVGL